MHQKIPGPVLAVCAEIIATRETHAKMDSLFMYAGAVGDPPPGSKPAKALAWLRAINTNEDVQPLKVLGLLIENYMEGPIEAGYFSVAPENQIKDRERIKTVLSQYGLQYFTGGIISAGLAAPSRTLEQHIKDRDIQSIDVEFERAIKNVEGNPREAVSAASNILESLCKVYIEEERLVFPDKQDLKSVWNVVRKHLGWDPQQLEDQDLQKILSGLISIVDGIASLRTHASSAHGAGKKPYKLQPRHARLSVHAAHTTVLFILETWKKKNAQKIAS